MNDDLKPAAEVDSFADAPLRSLCTENFGPLLSDLRISLVVSTYQANKLVVIRGYGDTVDTLFRTFRKPMGVAFDGGRLAVGTALQIWRFQNIPAVGKKLTPVGRHDACFLPRSSHVTGDIQIHEMAWAGDELWFINTRFSCICTVDGVHNFAPRWWPAFISALAPEDRCHLNGLCIVDGAPCFATALGETDAPGGWRANKRDGGILLELSSQRTLLRGLSMPHSPRWFDGRLWLLESGRGTVGYVDPKAMRYRPIATLPGFTRGLDFCGPLAFVGLSQVRETAVFSGIPITEMCGDRLSGVWVIDTRDGSTVAYLQFEEAVQELFSVVVLPSISYPDIINDNDALVAQSFELPDDALRVVPPAMRSIVGD